MTTAFGPQGPNFSLVRPPGDPDTSGVTDTWFINCSAPGAKDGTYATADFFNVFVGNLRYAVRTAGVPLDDTDDAMLYKAIKAIVDAEIAAFLLDKLIGRRGVRKVVGTGLDLGKFFIESDLGTGLRPVLT